MTQGSVEPVEDGGARARPWHPAAEMAQRHALKWLKGMKASKKDDLVPF